MTTNGTPVIGSTEFQSRRDVTGLYTLTFPPGLKVVACTTATWGNQAWFTNANGFPADGNSVAVAIVTTAGQLPAKNVIHVPTMEEPGMMIGAENVRRAARAALIAADRNNFKVIAIPGIGTDLGNVPIDEAARAIVEEIRAHRRPNPETIYLVDMNEEMVAALEEALRNAQANL